MRKQLIIAAAIASLSGCAVPQAKPDRPLDQVQPTPVCSGEQQCSEMWGRAIQALPMVTRMKVMSATDTFLQTYPTNKIGFLNGQVYKQSLGGGKYAIKGEFSCAPYTWCDSFRNTTQHSFNMWVQGYDPVN
ncbi:hypothetical protein [Pseudomonas asiatica]|uniref:hypothetical protein n=1 Tax=Pseudomonas asiatica TaxID=2219225 RepID=UPI0018AB780E|nr:hypothetical protein [Pseudomonas asiatica]MBF8805503.1 hypothetical protein [Pseudomonas asiatica]